MKAELIRIPIGYNVYDVIPKRSSDCDLCAVYINISGELFDRYEKAITEHAEIQSILNDEYTKQINRMNDL